MTLDLPPIDDKALLGDPTAELFRVSMAMATHSHNLRQAAVGRTVAGGADFRGTVVAVGQRDATLKRDDGTVHTVPLSSKRVAALMSARDQPADTTRK